jgi:UDP-N-acetylmuramoyl-tripeptide--D-alanyl-D-alanine ligase
VSAFGWTSARVARALDRPPPPAERGYAAVCTDTRALRPGDLYVALLGERFDGHDFLDAAVGAGALGAIVRDGTPPRPGLDWFPVPDTLVAYGRLARARRDACDGPVVAITGTNGKTSTKELTAAALGARLRVHRSPANLNNLVGVPRTLLAMPVETEVAVIECGANQRGELARMREMARPDIAVITNVDAGHLEGFGGVDGVLAEKVSLAEGAPHAIVGSRPPRLATAARAVATRVTTVATGGAAEWVAEELALGGDGRARFRVRGVPVALRVPGLHQVENGLIALAVADALGVPLEDAARALATADLPGGRTAVFDVDGVTVVDDTYNANPPSVAAALDLLGAIRGDRRAVVVVGTMRELGEASTALHAAAAAQVVALEPAVIVAVGAFAPALEALRGSLGGADLVTGETPAAVAERLRSRVRPGDVVLFKASRGVRLEQLFPILWPSYGGGEAH